MTESIITAKGQTTVPADIREQIQAWPGTKLVWNQMPDGTIVVRAKTKSVLDLKGMIKPAKGRRKQLAIEDLGFDGA